MKKYLLLLPILLLSASLILLKRNVRNTKEHEVNGEENPIARLEWERKRLADPATGEVPSMALWKAYLDLVSKGKISAPPFYSQANTRDAEWQQVNDFFASLAITKITYDPNNPQTFYFVTGEGWYNADATVGAGVFKSSDAGNSWNQLASTANPSFNYCYDVDVHSSDSNVYVGTMSGLWRSHDGGSTWKRVLYPSGSLNHAVVDIEFTKNGNIFAATGTYGQTGAIYYSENGDSGTWVKQINGFPTTGIYRVEIATSPSNDSVVYAVACNTTDLAIKGMYKTEDKGQSWFQVSTPGDNDTLFAHFQAWYDLILGVNPTNENDVLAGGWKIWRTRDGGNKWYQITHGNVDSADAYQYVHVDEHAIVFRNSDTVYIGNDGGIWKCGNYSDSLPNIYERNYGYRVTQFYAGDLAQQAGNNTVIGGSQDNGTTMITNEIPGSATLLTGYDGGFCAINYQDPSIMYTTKNSNGIFRKKNYGYSIADTITNPYLNDNNTLFINPMALDRADPEILYMGSGLGLWRLKNASTAKDSDWVQASKISSGISVIASSVSQPHTVYIGKTGSSKIYRLEHADTSTKTHAWINCDPGNYLPPNGISTSISCSGLYVDPDDVNHVISVYSNYSIKNIWETHDATAPTPVWKAHDGDLPNLPVHTVFVHPDNSEVCYVGTELGVFYTNKLNGDSTDWIPSNDGLANIRVTDLLYKESDHTITAMTYGRGIFTATIPSGPDYSLHWSERGPKDVGGRTRAIMIDPNDPTGQTVWAGGVSGGLWKTTNIDGIPAVGIPSTPANNFSMNVFPNPVSYAGTEIQFSLPSSQAVSIFIYDGKGSLIQPLLQNQTLVEGVHTIHWTPDANDGDGIFYVIMKTEEEKMVKKVLVIGN